MLGAEGWAVAVHYHRSRQDAESVVGDIVAAGGRAAAVAADLPRQGEEEFRRRSEAMPLGRGPSPEEIAQAVRFILAAPAMTGQMIALDGGQHLGWAQPAEPPPWEE